MITPETTPPSIPTNPATPPVALVVAVYFIISAHLAAMDAERQHRKHWSTLRCGERFLDQDMSKYASHPFRTEVIDIGKAGCSDTSFFATFDEIRWALGKGPAPPHLSSTSKDEDRYSQVFWFKFWLEAVGYAAAAFVIVNLGGLLFLGTRKVFRWISAGYRQEP